MGIPDDIAPANVAEGVLDSKYEQHIGNITCNEIDRGFMRGYLAIKTYFGLFRVNDFKCALSTDLSFGKNARNSKGYVLQ